MESRLPVVRGVDTEGRLPLGAVVSMSRELPWSLVAAQGLSRWPLTTAHASVVPVKPCQEKRRLGWKQADNSGSWRDAQSVSSEALEKS